MSTAVVITADARRLPLPDGSVHCVITSPPYYGLRDYQTATWDGGSGGCDHQRPSFAPQLHVGSDGKIGRNNTNWDHRNEAHYRDVCGKCGARRVDRQLGLEATPKEYVAAMVRAFREVKRVLRDDGTCWLNIGDSYNSAASSQNGIGLDGKNRGGNAELGRRTGIVPGLKPKNLMGIPWRLAFALQDDGWWLRDAIIWSKADLDDDDVLEGSAMPGSQRDRCTSAYEFVFQLTKSERYYFDAEAIKSKSGAMPRNVWRINACPWKGAHFATFAPALVERCVKAGTSERGCCPTCGAPWERETERGDQVEAGHPRGENAAWCEYRRVNGASIKKWTTKQLGWRPSCTCPARDPIPATVFDPFVGSGTTGAVATGLGRRFVGVDLSADYCRMAVRRISRPHASHRTPRKAEDYPLFAGHVSFTGHELLFTEPDS